MSDQARVAERYRRAAARFTDVAAAAPQAAWDNPAPPEGWTARDVVGHLVDWFPPFLAAGANITLPVGPSVDDDPLAAWRVLSDGVQAVLDDPTTSARWFEHAQAGRHPLDQAIGMFMLGDVVLHTWDLARAVGGDDTLEPDEVGPMLSGMEPLDDVLRASGHYGPRVAVADDADAQSRLIAFTGRDPGWTNHTSS